MGYDIYSLREDREVAVKHAKKYGSLWLNDDGEYDYKAPSTLYFRLNIWGMPILREFHSAIGFDEVNENLMDNSGNIIKDYECRELSEAIAALDDEAVEVKMREVLDAHQFYSANPTSEQLGEAAKEWVSTIREWQEFLAHCSDLKGCEVL